jgi:hypothetical protein
MWAVLGWEWETSVPVREVYAVTVLNQASSRWEVRSCRRPERVTWRLTRMWAVLGWEWETSVLVREVYAVTVLNQVSSRREVRSCRRPERVTWRLTRMWAVVNWVRENNSGSENSAVQDSSRRELWRVLRWRDLCVIFGVWDCDSFCVEIRC